MAVPPKGTLLNLEHPLRCRVTRDVISFKLSAIPTRFVQSLKLMKLNFGRPPTDSWILDKLAHRSISTYFRELNPLKFGVFSSFAQSERHIYLSDFNLGALPKSRLTKLVHLCKLKDTSSSRSPIDGSTCDNFMHPVKFSHSRFRIPSKHGVIFRFVELLKSILFKLGRFCEARINHKHFSIVVLKLEFCWFGFLNCNNNKLKTSYKFTCIYPILFFV